MDLKAAGSYVYMVGETRDELGGGHYSHQRLAPGAQPAVPKVDLALAPRLMAALHAAITAGLLRACHDLSEGGLGVAAAEMAFAGELGMALELATLPRPAGLDDDTTLLFAESPTRFLAEVRPANAAAFEAALAGLPCARVGVVTPAPELAIVGVAGSHVLYASVAELKAAWQGTIVV
jgi:phosphoribosylformylglycinamidine synthase